MRSQAAALGHARSDRAGDTASAGPCCVGSMYVLVMAGAVYLAHAEIDAIIVPTTTPESAQLAGMLALCQAFLAMAEKRPGDVTAALELASELAERTGEVNAYGLGFGPRRSVSGGHARRGRAATIGRRPGSPRAWRSRLTHCVHGRRTTGSPMAGRWRVATFSRRIGSPGRVEHERTCWVRLVLLPVVAGLGRRRERTSRWRSCG